MKSNIRSLLSLFSFCLAGLWLAVSPLHAADDSMSQPTPSAKSSQLHYLKSGKPDVVALLAPPPLPGSAEQAADLAEVIAVRQGGLMAGESVLSLRPSTLAVDDAGYLAGDLALSLSKASQGVMALGAVGVLPQETAAVASGLTGVQLPGKPLEATLSFRDGQTWLGPLPLGPAPRVY